MKILCTKFQPKMAASQQVNRVGQYLYKNLDGAYKLVKSSNVCDVYVTLLYQLKPEYGGKVNDVQEMTLDINITTYNNKLRVNTIELTPEERTLGSDILKLEDVDDLQTAKSIIMWKVGNRVRKAYENYKILF